MTGATQNPHIFITNATSYFLDVAVYHLGYRNFAESISFLLRPPNPNLTVLSKPLYLPNPNSLRMAALG